MPLRTSAVRKIALLVVLAMTVASCGPSDAGDSTTTSEPSTATTGTSGEAPSTSSGGTTTTEGPGEPVTVKLGIYDYMMTTHPFENAAERWEAANPNIDIEITVLAADDLPDAPAAVQRYALEAQNGEASFDAIIGVTPWIEVAPLVEAGALRPLDDLYPEGALDDLPDSVRLANTYSDGSSYSLPMALATVLLIWRKDFLEEVTGSPDQPKTWDELIETATAIEAAKPGVNGFGADFMFSHRLFLPLMVTLTDEVFTEEGLFNLDQPAAVEALQLIKDLSQFFPENVLTPLGSSLAFQADEAAMIMYWEKQVGRAITAGVDPGAIGLGPNPENAYPGTLFWNSAAVIQKEAAHAQEAVDFLMHGVMWDPVSVQWTIDNYGATPWYSTRSEIVVPEWAEATYDALEVSTGLPVNPYWLGFEQGIFREEIERMIIEDVSAEDTRDAMLARFEEAFADFNG